MSFRSHRRSSRRPSSRALGDELHCGYTDENGYCCTNRVTGAKHCDRHVGMVPGATGGIGGVMMNMNLGLNVAAANSQMSTLAAALYPTNPGMATQAATIFTKSPETLTRVVSEQAAPPRPPQQQQQQQQQVHVEATPVPAVIGKELEAEIKELKTKAAISDALKDERDHCMAAVQDAKMQIVNLTTRQSEVILKEELVKQTIEPLNTRISDLEKEKIDLMSKVASYGSTPMTTVEKAELERQRNVAIHDMGESKQKQITAEAERDEVAEKLTAANTELVAANAKISSINEELVQAKAEATGQTGDVVRQKAEMEAEHKRKEKASKDALDAKIAEVQTLKANLDSSTAELDTCKQAETKLKEDLAAVVANRDAEKQRADGLMSRATAAEAEAGSLRKAISDAEAAHGQVVTNLSKEIDDLKQAAINTKGTQDQTTANLKQKITDLEKAVSDAEAARNKAIGEIAAMKQAATEAKAEHDRVVGSLNGEITALRQAATDTEAAHKKASDDLKEKITTLRQAATEAKAEHDQAIRDLNGEITTLRQAATSAKAEHDRVVEGLDGEITALRQAATEAKAANDRTVESLNGRISTLEQSATTAKEAHDQVVADLTKAIEDAAAAGTKTASESAAALEKTALNNEHAEAIRTLNQAHGATVKILTDRIAELETASNSANSANTRAAEAIEELKTRHQEEITAINTAAAEAKTAAVSAAVEQQKQNTDASHAETIRLLNEAHQAALNKAVSDAEESAATALSEAKTAAAAAATTAAVAAASQQKRELEAAHLAEVTALNKAVSDAKAATAAVEAAAAAAGTSNAEAVAEARAAATAAAAAATAAAAETTAAATQAHQGEINALNARIRELEQNVTKPSEELLRCQSTQRSCLDENALLRVEHDTLTKRISDLAVQIAAESKQAVEVVQLQKKVAAEVLGLQLAEDAITAQVASHKSYTQKLQAKIDNLSASAAASAAAIAAAQEEIAAAQQQAAETGGQIKPPSISPEEMIVQQVKQAQQAKQEAELRSKMAAMQREIQEQESNLLKLKETITRKKLEETEVNNISRANLDNMAEMNKHLDELRKNLDKADEQRLEAENNLIVAERERDNVLLELSGVKAEADRLRAEKASEIASCSKAVDDLRIASAKLKAFEDAESAKLQAIAEAAKLCPDKVADLKPMAKIVSDNFAYVSEVKRAVDAIKDPILRATTWKQLSSIYDQFEKLNTEYVVEGAKLQPSGEDCSKLAGLVTKYRDKHSSEMVVMRRNALNIYEDNVGAVRVYVRVRTWLKSKTDKSYSEIRVVDGVKVLTRETPTDKPHGPYYTAFPDGWSNESVFTGRLQAPGSREVDMGTLSGPTDEYKGLHSLFAQLQDGYTVVMFGYGLSGSGKTFTLFGSTGAKLPGVVQIGLKNLPNVKSMSIAMAFELYTHPSLIPRFIRSRLHLLYVGEHYKKKYSDMVENYAKKMKGESSKSLVVDETKSTSGGRSPGFDKVIDGFTGNIDPANIGKLMDETDEYRRVNKRIKATPLNPNSSRSHLVYIYRVDFTNGKVGHLVVMDMAGKENPKSFLKMFIGSDTTIDLETVLAPSSLSLEKVPGWCSLQYIRGESGDKDEILKFSTNLTRMLPLELLKARFPNGWVESAKTIPTNKPKSPVTYVENNGRINVIVANTEGGSPKWAEFKDDDVKEMLREGVYINETIHHISCFLLNQRNQPCEDVKLQEFGVGKYDPKRVFNSPSADLAIINGTGVGIMAKYATLSNSLWITAVLKFFTTLSDVPNTLTKYVMMCNVRQDASVVADTEETLDFADSVKST